MLASDEDSTATRDQQTGRDALPTPTGVEQGVGTLVEDETFDSGLSNNSSSTTLARVLARIQPQLIFIPSYSSRRIQVRPSIVQLTPVAAKETVGPQFLATAPLRVV